MATPIRNAVTRPHVVFVAPSNWPVHFFDRHSLILSSSFSAWIVSGLVLFPVFAGVGPTWHFGVRSRSTAEGNRFGASSFSLRSAILVVVITAFDALDSHWNCRLTTIGRRSGAPRKVTIWFAVGPEVLYLTGGSENPHWTRNIDAHEEVSLEIGGHRLFGRAHVVRDSSTAVQIRQCFVDRYWLARVARWFGGYTRSVAVEVVVDRAEWNSSP